MRIFRILSRALAAMAIVTAFALPSNAAPATVNVDKSGLAILGYDPVAYFEMKKPVKGRPSITATHDGAIYHFATARHRKLFAANPEKYVPAYGGWCSYGMRYGQISRIDPRSWDIVNGRLHLSLNQGTRAVWLRAIEKNITIADNLWNKIFLKK